MHPIERRIIGNIKLNSRSVRSLSITPQHVHSNKPLSCDWAQHFAWNLPHLLHSLLSVSLPHLVLSYSCLWQFSVLGDLKTSNAKWQIRVFNRSCDRSKGGSQVKRVFLQTAYIIAFIPSGCFEDHRSHIRFILPSFGKIRTLSADFIWWPNTFHAPYMLNIWPIPVYL